MSHRQPTITLDGPAGAGKSTVARRVAERLGLRFLDTGAMYRAYTWKALQEGLDLSRKREIVKLIRRSRLELEGDRVGLDGRDISREIRREEVTRSVVHLASSASVRWELVRQQRQIGKAGGLVTEGRDQGSVVFTSAEVKIYMDASVEERARRRWEELRARGERTDRRELERAIRKRDLSDRRRKTGPLRRTRDMVYLDTSRLTLDQVVERVLLIVRSKVGP